MPFMLRYVLGCRLLFMQWDRLRNDLLGRWLCLLRLFAAGVLIRLGVFGAGVRFPLAYPSMAKNRLDNLVAHLLGEHSTGCLQRCAHILGIALVGEHHCGPYAALCGCHDRIALQLLAVRLVLLAHLLALLLV